MLFRSPQHLHTYRSWCETVYRCPAVKVPQVWDTSFAAVLEKDGTTDFGYRERPGGWRVGILDSNITVMKTSHMPILACEWAHRTDPAAIAKVHIVNALQFADDGHFKRFVGLTTLAADNRIFVENRMVIWRFLAGYADAVVTHQWENGLNYLYYDVLYGNYPLIHNSPFLKDYGYYYADFDAEDGGRALIEARRDHGANLDSYARRNAALFRQLDPCSDAQIALHHNLLHTIS